MMIKRATGRIDKFANTINDKLEIEEDTSLIPSVLFTIEDEKEEEKGSDNE